MTLSFEAVLVALVLLLPGFIASRITTYFSTSPERTLNSLDSGLSSLGVSVAILASEALVASLALGILRLASQSTFDHLQLNFLVQHGPKEYFQKKPLLVAVSVGAAGLVATTCAVVIGLFDPVGALLRKRLASRGQSEKDVWFMIFQKEKDSLGKQHAYVEVTLKETGDVFQGVMRGFSLTTNAEGYRDFSLEDVTYLPKGDVSRATKYQGTPRGSALLNSRDVESIRIIYV